MSDCTVSPVKAFLVYHQLLVVYWLIERNAVWHPYNAATGVLSSVSPRSVFGQKRAVAGFVSSSKDEEVPIRLRKFRMMTISAARSAAYATLVQFYERVPLYHNNMSEDGDDRVAVPVEQILDLQDLRDQSVVVLSALQKTQLLFQKAGLHAPTTVLEAQDLIAQRPATIPRNSILFSALPAGSDVFKVEKDALLSEVNKLKYALAFKESNRFSSKLIGIRRIYDANVSALKEMVQKNEKRPERLHSWADLLSRSRRKEVKALEKLNAVIPANITKLTGKTDSERLKIQQRTSKKGIKPFR